MRKYRINPTTLIAKCLRDKNMTQADLAEKAGISPAYLSRIMTPKLTQKRYPSPEAISSIERTLGLQENVLMNLYPFAHPGRFELIGYEPVGRLIDAILSGNVDYIDVDSAVNKLLGTSFVESLDIEDSSDEN